MDPEDRPLVAEVIDELHPSLRHLDYLHQVGWVVEPLSGIERFGLEKLWHAEGADAYPTFSHNLFENIGIKVDDAERLPLVVHVHQKPSMEEPMEGRLRVLVLVALEDGTILFLFLPSLKVN